MKKLLLSICISSLIFTGCTPKEKTTVLEEDVLINEIDYANKINMEKLDIKLEEGYQFEPGFFYEDKVYGIIRNQGEPDNKIYKGYYSKADGIVKEGEILEVEAFSDISYRNRRVISDYLDYRKHTDDDNTIKIRDNATGEVKKFPNFIGLGNEIRRTSDKNNNTSPYVQLLDIKANEGENISYSDRNQMVIGNDNYGYYHTSRNIFEGEAPPYEYINGKLINRGYKRSYNALVLYNFDENTTLTYDGILSAEEFPFIQRIMYDNKNNSFYALAGQLENQLYKIDIKDNKFNLQLIYTFDLGERYIDSWNAKIIDGNLIVDSSIPVATGTEGESMNTEEKILLFNLSTMEITETTGATNVTSRLLSLNSNKYFIINNYNMKSFEGKTLLARVKDNKIEYIYNFTIGPIFTAIDEENENLFVADYNEKGGLDYYLYNIDID